MSGDGGGSREVFCVVFTVEEVLVEKSVCGVEFLGVELKIAEEGFDGLLNSLLHKLYCYSSEIEL